MAFNWHNLLCIYTIFSLFLLSLTNAAPPKKNGPPSPPRTPPRGGNRANGTKATTGGGGGSYKLLQRSVGVSAMHMQLMPDNKIMIFDRTGFGPSNLSLPAGKCRIVNETEKDCTAHSLLYDIATNTFRPLFVQTNVWCSSGALGPDGTLVQTGGYQEGEKHIRLFKSCKGKELCDWIKHPEDLYIKRWYATNQILPDGRIIIVGGSDAFNYEFFPRDKKKKDHEAHIDFPFLKETTDQPDPNNLYPGIHLLPDGNLYIFANRRSILFDYNNNKVIKEYPQIPGESRSYPSTGSTVMLPLTLSSNTSKSPDVEILVCGGTKPFSPQKAKEKKIFIEASKNCGRLNLGDRKPKWAMENMPMPRSMGDMIQLPTGHVLIINGAKKGSAGWEMGEDPVLNPVLYKPKDKEGKRFHVLNPMPRPRMYHSAATLMPDGRVLIGGSNPHEKNDFHAKFPTDMSLEAFSPGYMSKKKDDLRPTVKGVSAKDSVLKYGQKFNVKFTVKKYKSAEKVEVILMYPIFVTHSTSMGQRMLVLATENIKSEGSDKYDALVHAPATANLAPPGYYMLFVVHDGVPSHSVWVRFDKSK